MGNLNSTPTIVVVYKTMLENTRVDDIIDATKRKPIIPKEADIIEIGVGKGFEAKYRKKFNL